MPLARARAQPRAQPLLRRSASVCRCATCRAASASIAPRCWAGCRCDGRNFEILEEILVKAYAAGWRVRELPFTYYPRERGASHARIVQFGLDLLRVLRPHVDAAQLDRLRRLRRARLLQPHSAAALLAAPAPRDHHPHGARRRAARSTSAAARASSCRASTTPSASTSQQNKLRYMRRYGVPLVRGSVFGAAGARRQLRLRHLLAGHRAPAATTRRSSTSWSARCGRVGC